MRLQIFPFLMMMRVDSLHLIFLRSQGVNILINTWDKDDNSGTDDIVDEFSYDYTGEPGIGPKVVDIQSVTRSRDSR
mgnify:CR=1 FL=1